MNKQHEVKFAAPIENPDLRELSHAEKFEVNGGLACYNNPHGLPNPVRYVHALLPFTRAGHVATQQFWIDGRYKKNKDIYLKVPRTKTLKAYTQVFKNYCRSIGFTRFL